ncbi:hypothetical protein AALT_g1037 [Alternaria alternata]|nr:hypothetical protein AALT_g1037 [Alternaria alternata]
MIPLASPDHFRRKKRLPDDSLPASLGPSKRTRMNPELQSYDEIHQHVLLAAAKTLRVPVEKLLSLAASSNVSSRPHSVDVFSRSNSDDPADDITPPEDSEHDDEYESYDFSSPEKLHRSSTANTIWDPRIYSQTHTGHNIESVQNQRGRETNKSFDVDLFAPPDSGQAPPTPRDDHGVSNNDEFSSTGNSWNGYSAHDFSVPSYQVGCTNTDQYLTPPLSASTSELDSFTAAYLEASPAQIVQSLQGFDGQSSANAHWGMVNQWSGGPSVGSFDPISDVQEDVFQNARFDITQGVGKTSFTLQVRKFRPVEGDALCRKWKADGVEHSYECATYAIADMKEAGKTMFDFAQSNLPTAIRFWVDEKDPLLRSTYNMAYNYSFNAEREEDRKLLSATLRMWSASRMMSRSDYICGRETLGMQRRNYGPNSTNTGKILTPPVFSAQMEDHERAEKQGLKQRFYRPRVIAELHNGAKIILAYFHFCNRGDYPLHMDWNSEDQTRFTGLRLEQIEFMRRTKSEAENKTLHFHSVLNNHAYEDEYYFLAQLWERDWKPRHTI